MAVNREGQESAAEDRQLQLPQATTTAAIHPSFPTAFLSKPLLLSSPRFLYLLETNCFDFRCIPEHELLR